jgi:hypothetical protein
MEAFLILAEAYYGVWRYNSPHHSGVFAWFTGDVYLGEWSEGQFHGYGCYRHGPEGVSKGNVYEGQYHQGSRQGSGVYKFKMHGKGPQRANSGGVYLGEWLRGTFNGRGILTYGDDEQFAGEWEEDMKSGLGVRSLIRILSHADVHLGKKFSVLR